MLLAFVHSYLCFDFGSVVDVLGVQVVVNCLHRCRWFAVCPTVLVDDLDDELVQAVHVVHLLGRDVAYNTGELGILITIFKRHLRIASGVLDLFRDLLAQFFDDTHGQHTFVTVMFASAMFAADPEITCRVTGDAQQQQELSRSTWTSVLNPRLVPVLWA